MIMLEGRVAEICFTCKREKPAVSHIFIRVLCLQETVLLLPSEQNKEAS